jgi:endonuclease YncB( thermonuclease family)
MLRFVKVFECHPARARPGGIKSLEHVDAGHRTVSHAQNKSPMRMTFKTAAIALALCLVFQVQADTLLGKVINVADGDTITVLDDTHTQHKIRLTGIDAPEKRQAFGNVSKQSLDEQVAGQSVAVEWVKVDKYGRKLGKVLLAGLDCNLVQVKRGLAWHYKQYQREQSPTDQQSYAVAEIEARAAKLGLWRDADPVPPWEFRHKGKP